jgi:trans-aconitate methyltransferase
VRVADYGSGWGRITRLCTKDVPKERLLAIEPNELLCQSFRDSRIEAQLIESDWESHADLPITSVDFVLCFAVFTHASKRLARNMLCRLAAITGQGAIVAITVRPGAMLHAEQGEIKLFDTEERIDGRQDYFKGHYVFKPYSPGTDWGVAVPSNDSLHELCRDLFEIVGMNMLLQNWTQKVVYLRRL